MNSVLHYFISSDVPRAVSYYDSNFAPLRRTIRLSGYPHPVLEEVLSAVCRHAQEENTPLHCIHHCLDHSLCGVILPDHSAGVYGFDVYDEAEPNFLAVTRSEELSLLRANLETARKLFTEARSIHDEQEKIYIGSMDFAAADRLTEDTIRLLFGGMPRKKNGTEVHRFFGAATVNGNVNYIPEVTRDIPKRYLIKGRPGTGKSTFLKKIAQAAVDSGCHTEIYHCSLDPKSLDLVAVRELGFCVFDSTPPHEYFPSRSGDEIIDIYAACVTPGTDEKYRNELQALDLEYKNRISAAAAYLKEIKKAGEAFDASLPQPDPAALAVAASRITERLFAD